MPKPKVSFKAVAGSKEIKAAIAKAKAKRAKAKTKAAEVKVKKDREFHDLRSEREYLASLLDRAQHNRLANAALVKSYERMALTMNREELREFIEQVMRDYVMRVPLKKIG